MAKKIEQSKVDEIVAFFRENSLSMEEVANKFGVSIGTVFRFVKKSGIDFDRDRARRGHRAWNSGLCKSSDIRIAKYAETKSGFVNAYGYRKIWSPLLLKSVFEHHVIWFNATGHWPDTSNDEQIHHVDGDKLNNDITNLALCSTSQHTKVHKSYEELVFKLFKAGWLEFDKQSLTVKGDKLWNKLNG